MSLNFGQVVGCNNLLALKAFSTFLFNYSLHEKPNFLGRMVIKSANRWIELRARKEFIELKKGIENTSLNLNDCQTGMFTVLYLASQNDITFSNGKELFQLIASTELEFEKIKKPRVEAKYGTTHGAEFGSDPK